MEAVTKRDSEGVVAQPQQDWREVLAVQTSANLAAHRTGRNVVCARPLLDGTLMCVLCPVAVCICDVFTWLKASTLLYLCFRTRPGILLPVCQGYIGPSVRKGPCGSIMHVNPLALSLGLWQSGSPWLFKSGFMNFHTALADTIQDPFCFCSGCVFCF